jgi:transposase
VFYVGLDVRRHRTRAAVIDDEGHELLNSNVINDPEQLGSLLCGLEPRSPVVLEAAYGWSWVVELLEEMDLEAHLAHPAACKAIAFARLKNDRVDARTLA